MFKKLTLALFSLLYLSVPLTLHAHTEHEEIQVKSKFEVNDQHQLSAITMVWLYDPFTSEDMLNHEKDINRLAKTVISDISRFNFFTRINSGDRRLVANRIDKYKLVEVKNRDNNLALQLSFTLLFNKPIKVTSLKTIKIDHSDPTGKGILYYDKAEDIELTNELKSRCRSSVKEKNEFIEGQFPQIATITCRT